MKLRERTTGDIVVVLDENGDELIVQLMSLPRSKDDDAPCVVELIDAERLVPEPYSMTRLAGDLEVIDVIEAARTVTLADNNNTDPLLRRNR